MDIYADVAKNSLTQGMPYESYSTPEETRERNIAAGRPAEFIMTAMTEPLLMNRSRRFREEGRDPALRIKCLMKISF